MDYQAHLTRDELSGNFAGNASYDEIPEPLKEEIFEKKDFIKCVTFLAILIPVSISFVLMFYTVFRFRSLRTRTNFIILNFFTIAEIFALVAGVKATIAAFSPFNNRASNILLVIEISLFNVLISLALLLAFDWYSSVTWHRVFTKYAKYYKLIVGFLHFPLLLGLCSLVVPYYLIGFSGLTYIISFISVLTWNVIKVRRNYTKESLKTYYAFSCATFYIFIWLPVFLLLTMVFFPRLVLALAKYKQVMFWIIHTFVSVAIFAPVLITLLLIRWDDQVRMAFKQLFRIKNAHNQDLEGDVAFENNLYSENHYNEGLLTEENISA